MLNMKKIASLSLFIWFLIIGLNSGFAQNEKKDAVLVTIAGERITKSEFLNVYRKNNVNSNVLDKKSIGEYLDLYINFKLKVKEAEDLGLDTVKAFIDELKGYRTQLAQPYLTDEKMVEKLIREAYDREKQDVRVSHILIRDVLPADTLAAYNKITDLRNKIMGGADFGAMAVQYSEDPSAQDRLASPKRPAMKGNAGDLGYFTVLDMVYPFETAAYNTPVGEVSQPVRTNYGYHLIKVTDKKPAMGKVQVAHILIRISANASPDDSLRVKDKAFKAYQEIINGKDFTEAVKEYSDDKGTADKGGVLPWFGVNRMIPEFIIQVSQLKQKGDITPPFLTTYGWHLVKLLDKKEIGSMEDNMSDLKQKVTKNDRIVVSKESFIDALKKDYSFKKYRKNIIPIYALMDSSIFKGKWDIGKAANLKKPLFKLAGKKYTQYDFAGFLNEKQTNGLPENFQNYVNNKYKAYVEETILNYEDSHLEDKYPEFKSLMKEYRDGILLFELTDQKVWSKAIKDTLGLEDFYKKNSNDYMWDQRIDASVFTLSNPVYVQKTRELAATNTPSDEILNMINQDTAVYLTILRDKYQKGDNDIIDQISWTKGLSDNFKKDGNTIFVYIYDLLPPQSKILSEARGIITADYQNFLEKEWIKTLHEKYPVVVNKAVLESIK
jgi:peptidyl-prolyl cis-trans isomerase SurA